MNTFQVIQNTEAFVKTRLEGEATGHDWFHADRVRDTGLTLQEKEGGDTFIIEVALLLHDVGDRKVLGTDNDDPTIAEDFLKNQKIGHAATDSIMHIISNMSFSKSLDGKAIDKSIEFQIVQDSDRLDALGAIGIARAFAFGGSRGRPLFNPDYVPQTFTSAADYKQAESSTLHHFDEKLFTLKNTFNTATATRMAEERDVYMHEFYNRFLAEWDSKK